MARLNFVLSDGEVKEREVPVGQSIMEAAKSGNIEDIIAECGGAMSCATCHVYVRDEWMGKLPPAGEIEMELLECVTDPRPNSRLSCQIILSDELDGITVDVPSGQY